MLKHILPLPQRLEKEVKDKAIDTRAVIVNKKKKNGGEKKERLNFCHIIQVKQVEMNQSVLMHSNF